jgi:hypothetical protein
MFPGIVSPTAAMVTQAATRARPGLVPVLAGLAGGALLTGLDPAGWVACPAGWVASKQPASASVAARPVSALILLIAASGAPAGARQGNRPGQVRQSANVTPDRWLPAQLRRSLP